VKLPLAAAEIVPPQLRFFAIRMKLKSPRIGVELAGLFVSVITVVRPRAEQPPAIIAKVVLPLPAEIKNLVNGRFVLRIIGPRRERAKDIGRAIPFTTRQAQRLNRGVAGIVLRQFRITGRGKGEPHLMMLVHPQAISFTTLNRAEISMIKGMIEWIAIVILTPGPQMFFTGRAEEFFDARFAEIKFARLRTPIMQSQRVARHFPLLGELLPEPAVTAKRSSATCTHSPTCLLVASVLVSARSL
jgi:hypothetical protein